FLTGIFILSAERQPIKLAWRKIVWLQNHRIFKNVCPRNTCILHSGNHESGEKINGRILLTNAFLEAFF
ncbi:hypothetical protein LDZ35_06805, partial [Bacteroides xylanisolvens]